MSFAANALAVVRYSHPEGIRKSIAETLVDTGLETSDGGLNGSQRSASVPRDTHGITV